MTGSGLWAYVEGLRRDRGWTQAELARRAGKDRQIFVRMRNGQPVAHETIHALARALDVPAAELLRRQGYPVEQLGVVSASVDPPPLSRGELLERARRELSHDELVGLVRERMPDAAAEDDVLRAHEPEPPLRATRPKPTGRRRPELDGEDAGANPAVSPSDGGY